MWLEVAGRLGATGVLGRRLLSLALAVMALEAAVGTASEAYANRQRPAVQSFEPGARRTTALKRPRGPGSEWRRQRIGGSRSMYQARQLRYLLKLAKAGIGETGLQQAYRHVELGAPSPADPTNPADLLLARNEYIVSYNAHTNTPNWVAFHTTKEDFGPAQRPKKFRRDPTLPEAWQPAADADYRGSGWTRGHLADAGSRSATARKIRKTFVLTNAVPQSYENNAGPWNDLETHLRDQIANQDKDVYTYTGPIYDQANPQRLGMGQVAVPSALWKIAVIVPRGTKMDDVTAETRVVSIIIPNAPGSVKLTDTFEPFRVAPQDIEARTGLTFFSNLEPSVRASLLRRVDAEPIQVHYAKSFKMSELRKRYGSAGVPPYWVEIPDVTEQ